MDMIGVRWLIGRVVRTSEALILRML